jgi:predicted RNA-binding protein
MLFRVYLEKELIMEGVRLVKGTPEGVAIKDDMGVSRVLDGVYVAEVEGVVGYITLRHAAGVARGS